MTTTNEGGPEMPPPRTDIRVLDRTDWEDAHVLVVQGNYSVARLFVTNPAEPGITALTHDQARDIATMIANHLSVRATNLQPVQED